MGNRGVLVVATAIVAAALAAAAPTAAAPAAIPQLPDAATLAADRAAFLQAAEAGMAQLDTLWWNRDHGWYKTRSTSLNADPLPSLWYAFPLFEAKAALTLTAPTFDQIRDLEAFAWRAEGYWDPTVEDGNGAFSWGYGVVGTGNAYFDDNGWWGIAYMDAYRATRNPRWLWDARRALDFIDRFGWDAVAGGTWWNVAHEHKTSEPLAAGALIAAEIYADTKDPTALAIARKYIEWADAHTLNPRQGNLYGRNADDGTVMDYVEGLMAAAHAELCAATGDRSWCARAEQIALASSEQFPILADWAPETDVIYLRGLLQLYRVDHDPRWYAIVWANAKRALALAGAGDGLYPLRWDGEWTLPGALYTQAATVELFAWLASIEPPAPAP